MMKDVPPEALLMTEENIMEKRAEMAGIVEYMCDKYKDMFALNESMIDQSDFMLDVGGGEELKMYVHRPKHLSKMVKQPCYIYAHGGGAVTGNAEENIHGCNLMALNLDCVVINCNYRKGPEVKAPGGQVDFANTVRHVYNNADSFGIDKERICMAGISGGGWICFGAATILAKAGDAHMVKANFVQTGQLMDCTRDLPKD